MCLNACGIWKVVCKRVCWGGGCWWGVVCVFVWVSGGELLHTVQAQQFISTHGRDAGGSGGNMASYFGRQQSAASMASLPPDEVEFELDLEVGFNLIASLLSDDPKYNDHVLLLLLMPTEAAY